MQPDTKNYTLHPANDYTAHFGKHYLLLPLLQTYKDCMYSSALSLYGLQKFYGGESE